MQLRELYAAFNDVSDVSPLAELDHLRAVDLEANRVADEDAPDYLGMCPALNTLSLEGNPLSRRRDYRRLVARAVKGLVTLDDRDVTEAERLGGAGGEEDEDGGRDGTGGRGPGEDGTGVDVGTSGEDEISMVADGIKYAAVGIDDPDAVITRDEVTGDLSIEVAEDPLADHGPPGGGEFFPSRPSTSASGQPIGARPGTSSNSSGFVRPSSRPGRRRPTPSRGPTPGRRA